MGIKVKINGSNMELENSVNIEGLLSSQGYKGKLVAVAINGAFISRISYGEHMINEKDEIEIVAPMQGG